MSDSDSESNSSSSSSSSDSSSTRTSKEEAVKKIKVATDSKRKYHESIAEQTDVKKTPTQSVSEDSERKSEDNPANTDAQQSMQEESQTVIQAHGTNPLPFPVTYNPYNELIKQELARIKTRMNTSISANLLKQPLRKSYHPFVWNSLRPYSDTSIINYMMSLPDNRRPNTREPKHLTRSTASRIVDPEVSWKMDNTVLPPIVPAANTDRKKTREMTTYSRIEKEFYRMHIDKVFLNHPALHESMKMACVTYMGQTPDTAKAIRKLTDSYSK
ncbi:uncharacterized protein LOC114657160 [Erpetoichthys calabaricus]|uniref:uncharacterized protein LOC114657160 n=1 Tax=Erpetoichthys calabaricus TaxID=27687 RepID=UPI00223437DE|nr:uncharacterized protein LOC114657160 [Erpetoichthys calabaricus]